MRGQPERPSGSIRTDLKLTCTRRQFVEHLFSGCLRLEVGQPRIGLLILGKRSTYTLESGKSGNEEAI